MALELTAWENQLIELIRRYPAAAGEMATALRIALQDGLITESEALDRLREDVAATLNAEHFAAESQDRHEQK